jgi:hypothetical protein
MPSIANNSGETATMPVELLYGKHGLRVLLPPSVRPTMIRKHLAVDPTGAVAHALAHPQQSPPLEEVARGKRSTCSLIGDITEETEGSGAQAALSGGSRNKAFSFSISRTR